MERSDADRYVSTGLADLNAQQPWTANTRDMARSDADRPLFTGPAGLNVLQNTTGPAGLNVQRPWTITTPQSCTEMHSPLLRSTTSRSRQSSHNYMDEHQGVPLHPEQVAAQVLRKPIQQQKCPIIAPYLRVSRSSKQQPWYQQLIYVIAKLSVKTAVSNRRTRR